MSKQYSVKQDTRHNNIVHAILDGEEIFFDAPRNGGYVRYYRDIRDEPRQICERLLRYGNTLQWCGKEPLSHLIRREMGKYRRDRKNEMTNKS